VLKESAGYTEIGRQRFRREAQATAGLSHHHLVTVYDRILEPCSFAATSGSIAPPTWTIRAGDAAVDYEAAVQDFTRAMESGRPLPHLFVLRGNTNLRLARHVEGKKGFEPARSSYAAALQDFRGAIRLNPGVEVDLKKAELGEVERKLSEL
jgi:hypothetical protein